MNSHYTYFLILAGSLLGPLLLSFDQKVAFYTKWKWLFPAMLPPALFYIAWDAFFTDKGVWHFNGKYITGIQLYNLPIEEVLFFFVVPYCCLFIYECIRSYFPNLANKPVGDVIFKLLAVFLLSVGLFYYDRYYTSWSFIFLALFIGLLYALSQWFVAFDVTRFLVAYVVILIPFMIVNGLLTAIPVVMYNDAENLGIRLYTIPFEDVFYGMLLVLMNIVIFETLRHRAIKSSAGTLIVQEE